MKIFIPEYRYTPLVVKYDICFGLSLKIEGVVMCFPMCYSPRAPDGLVPRSPRDGVSNCAFRVFDHAAFKVTLSTDVGTYRL